MTYSFRNSCLDEIVRLQAENEKMRRLWEAPCWCEEISDDCPRMAREDAEKEAKDA